MNARLPMTLGRVLTLVIGVPVVLVLFGWAALTAVAYAGQGSYPVRLDLPVAGGAARVSVDSGNITVGPTADSRLRVTGTARYSLIRSSVTWYRSRSGVAVVSRCRFPAGVCAFNLAVVVPASARAVLSDGSGDLTVRNLAGHVSAGSGSGDLRASGLSGTVDLGDGSGNILGTALSGPRVTLDNGSGDISFGRLTSADVVASDGSGDITLIFTGTPNRVHVDDDSGNVTLILPPGRTPYQVHASTSSGSRVVNVPTSPASRHVITVSDGSGNISITN
jgi:DUF4097 and DUF4098 domain-containing protein YvlB